MSSGLWCFISTVSIHVCLSSLSPKHNLAILKAFNGAGDVRGASLPRQTTHGLSHWNSSLPTVLQSSQRTVNQINELLHWPHTYIHSCTQTLWNTDPSLVLSFDFVASYFQFCLKAFKFTSMSFLSRLCINLQRERAEWLVSCSVTLLQVSSISCRLAEFLFAVCTLSDKLSLSISSCTVCNSYQ